MTGDIAIFEDHQIRRQYDETTETWYFSVVDIIQVLIQQPDFQTARKYWNKLRERLSKEGSEVVTNCHRLKMLAEDGKLRLTDAADAETLLRLIQSVPSPKAEPIKLWLAKVGYERSKRGGGIAEKARLELEENTEFSKELLWQELPTDRRSSYFREFWDLNGNTDSQSTDEEMSKEKPSINPKRSGTKARFEVFLPPTPPSLLFFIFALLFLIY